MSCSTSVVRSLSCSFFALIATGVVDAKAEYVSAGLDSTASIVANAESDGGSGLFAIIVGSDYDYSGSPYAAAQLIVENSAIKLNENTTIMGTVSISGTTTLNGLLDVNGGIAGENFSVADSTGNTVIGGTTTLNGATQTNGTLDVNGGIVGENFSVADGSGNTVVGGTTTLNNTLNVNGGIVGENFSIADGTGNTVIGGTTTLNGATQTNGTLDVNGGIVGENFSVANDTGNTVIDGTTTLNNTLNVNGGIVGENFSVNDDTGNTSIGGSLDVADDFTLDTNGGAAGGSSIIANDQAITISSAQTTLRGGTHSGVLTLDDGDSNTGTTLSISGSGGGTAATVLQATTDSDTTLVTTAIGTSSDVYSQSTTLVQAGSNSLVVDSGKTGTSAAVNISGTVSGTNTSGTGVLITGSGQNSTLYDASTATAPPSWADISLQSSSYGAGDPSRGSAIVVTDYGIQLINPEPAANETMYNVQGGNSGSGTVDNSIGVNSGSGNIINSLGIASASAGPNSNVTNNIGANHGAGAVTTNIGGGSSATKTNIGNTNSQSEVAVYAGASSLSMQNSSAIITGGTQGNSLAISNSGASFANSNGSPIKVTGVADGVSEFDAVNFGQFASGIASVAAMSAIPAMRPGETNAFGVGFGNFQGYTAWALGGRAFIDETMSVQFSAASSFRDDNLVYSLGAGWSW